MLIALNGISKSYQASHGAPPYQVLKDANLSIDKGEMVAIKGSSGAGKSTLLHIIGCLDKPTSGSYLLNGQNVSQLSLSKLAEIRNASFGFVMQHFALIEEDSALQNVATPLLFAKARRSQMDARAMEQLRNVGMEQMANKRIATLSGGEKQRVAIARAMVNNPEIILADEPTGALDRANTEKIVQLFQQLNEKGKTIIIVTHDDFVAQSCRRIVTIADGVIKRDRKSVV
mgnify:CR=1 FL=1